MRNKFIKIISVLIAGGFFIISGCNSEIDPNADMILWYQQPAEKWTEALPVGNGRLGAMVFGGIKKERIQLNEESLWAGEQINNNNSRASEYLSEIQQLLLKGKIKNAGRLADKYLLGTPPRIRSYQTLGDLWLDFDFEEEGINDYRRELNLSTGISSVTFKTEDITYTRRVFASAPDNILVIKISADKKSAVNLKVKLERKRDAQTTAISDNILVLQGQIDDTLDVLRGPAGKHMKFASRLIAINDGGKISSVNNHLVVKNADALILILTVATDYNIKHLNFDHSIDPLKNSENLLSKVTHKSYSELLKRHLADHQSLFNRVEINLGKKSDNDLATDKRLQKVKNGDEVPFLVGLYFQYGRYLLMGSSRLPGVLPANLQGIWNEHFSAPWSSDFHTNINLQMNYWPAEVCNLAVCHEP